jgi:MFS family permease
VEKVATNCNRIDAVVLMLCWLTCLMTASALLPNYLIDHIGLSFQQMGGVMSAIGLGAAVGTLSLPWLSDRIGRKPVMLLCSAGGIAALFMLNSTGANPTELFAWLFLVHFFNNAAITLTVGPLCAETVPTALMATASGVVIAVGELFGGGLAPFISGLVATAFGIDKLLLLPMATLALGFALSLLLIETRPRGDVAA